MDQDLKAWNVLSLWGLIMDRLDLNYWHMFIVWWLMSGVAAKLWVNICRSICGLPLVKAHMYASFVLHSSVYIMRYDNWSCSWIWLLLQSSVDYVFDRVSVFQYWVIQRLMMQVWLMCVLQWWLVMCFNDIDGSSMKIGWNMALRLCVVFQVYPVWRCMKCGTWRKKERVVAFCRLAPTY